MSHGLYASDSPPEDLDFGIPAGVQGIDAGMTMTKRVYVTERGVTMSAAPTPSRPTELDDTAVCGLTGARALTFSSQRAISVAELDAAARGCSALLRASGRRDDDDFVMALMGTGTAFAAVRGGSASHLGGTALGGGSFAGIAYRVAPELTYPEVISAAAAGDRRRADFMVADVYPEGLGRIGPNLTAAHVARRGDVALPDFLAGLLNLHAESIAMIAAGRARMANINRIVFCGGFIHNNQMLTAGLAEMASRFGHEVEVVRMPGYAGAIGAALIASEQSTD